MRGGKLLYRQVAFSLPLGLVLGLVLGLLVSLIAGAIRAPTMAFASEGQAGQLWLDVNQDTQLVRVMKGGTVLRAIIVSTGKPSTPTPNGVFNIQNRGAFFAVENASARYFTSFLGWGKYMFHSIIYDRKGRRINALAAERLGSKASHGCIRMPIHDAFWIYTNIPRGTKVVIHSSQTKPQKVQAKSGKVFSLQINGKPKSSRSFRWVDGELMVPVNDFASWLGLKTSFNPRTMEITLANGSDWLRLPMSVPKMAAPNCTYTLRIPALLIYNKIWIPYKSAVIALGYTVRFDQASNCLLAEKPIGQAANPAAQAARPAGQAANPSGQAANPAEQAAKPAGQAANPSGQETNPAEQAAKPADQSARPLGHAVDPAIAGSEPNRRQCRIISRRHY